MDLVAGTHGRSLWILDGMGCLAELPAVKDEPLHLFPVAGRHAATVRLPRLRQAATGYSRGPIPRSGAVDHLLAARPARGPPSACGSTNEAGQEVRTLGSPGRPGLNRVVWDLQADPKHRFDDPAQRRAGIRGTGPLPGGGHGG